MKLITFTFLFTSFCLIGQEITSSDGCHYSFDYSDTSGWTQVGTLVEIQSGQVMQKHLVKIHQMNKNWTFL